MIVAGKSEENNLTSSNSSEKNRIDILKEREEAKKRILDEDPHIPKDTLEFVLSLPKKEKYPKSRNWKLYMQQQNSKKKWKDY